MNFQVGLRRIALGKWGCNNGQACIAPDYLLIDEIIASEVVSIILFFWCRGFRDAKLSHLVGSSHYSSGCSLCLSMLASMMESQVDTLIDVIETFYGKDPKTSQDLSRIVNTKHYSRLAGFLDDPKISSKIVHGGARDDNKL